MKKSLKEPGPPETRNPRSNNDLVRHSTGNTKYKEDNICIKLYLSSNRGIS